MNVDLTHEAASLRAIRIKEDQPYRVLADAIGMTEPALYRLLNANSVVGNERTAYKVRAFLAKQKRARRRSK